MVVSSLLILIAISFMMLKEQERVEHHMEIEAKYVVSQVDEKLYYVQNSLELMAANLMEGHMSLDDWQNKEMRSEIIRDMKMQVALALHAEELCYTGYFRIAPEVAGNGTEGFFIGYNQAGELEEYTITDLSVYDSKDIEHFGWYTIPLNYGHAVWMEPYYNANKEVCMISYVVPLYADDQVIGVLGMDIDVEDLTAYVRHLEADNLIKVLLRDRGENPVPGMSEPSNITNYVMRQSTLLNEMSLTVYADKAETYVIRYHTAYYIVIVFSVLLLLYGIFYLVVAQKRKDAVTQERRVPVVPIVLASLAGITVIGMTMFYLVANGNLILRHNENKLKPHNVYPHSFTVVADENYAPFSYLDEDGNPTGYDIAMIYELADRFKYNVELKLLPLSECEAQMNAGSADVILGLDAFSSTGEGYIKTEITSTDALMIYARAPVNSISDVLGKSIATVENVDQLDAYGVLVGAERYSSYEEEFHALMIGKVDYVVARKQVSERILENEEYANILPVYNLMQCQSCYGVNSKNSTLLNLMNRALVSIKKNGMDITFYERYVVKKVNKTFMERYGLFVYIVLGIVTLLLASSVLVFLVQRNNRRLRRLSEIDALTGINNRGGGEAKIRSLIRQRIPGMFCLLDIDKFKSINDTYGHSVGDQVLIAMADCMKEVFRDRDIVMRLGGDEFAVYVPQVCDKENGVKIIERFFEAIHLMRVEDLDGHEVNVSLGAAFYDGAPEDDFASLYLRADKGTYISKKMIGNTYHFEVED